MRQLLWKLELIEVECILFIACLVLYVLCSGNTDVQQPFVKFFSIRSSYLSKQQTELKSAMLSC